MDSDVRRSLMLIRSHLSRIEPSADFSSRLAGRLEAERMRMMAPAPLFRGPGVGGFLSLSVAVVALGLMAMVLSGIPAEIVIAQHAAVVFRPTEVSVGMESPVPTAPTLFVASVSTGMAVWPALLLMEEAPMRAARGRPRVSVRTVSYSPGLNTQ